MTGAFSTLERQLSVRSCHSGLIWVYLNGRCNFTCAYCLDGRNNIAGRAATRPDFVDRLAVLQRVLGYSLVFTGGEPLIEFDVLQRLFTAFADVPKTVQTNGSLRKNAEKLLPYFSSLDWLSVSLHDETLQAGNRAAVDATICSFIKAGRRVLIQLMCSPANTRDMLEHGRRYQSMGCKVNARRLFEYESACYDQHREAIAQSASDPWAEAAFFGTPADMRQPFRAAVVYLDGRIGFVCRGEVPVGNLYTGYDLSLVERHRGAPCDAVCHCCSCLWVHQEWGFA